ncbi:MAG: hypothetical protein LDL44_00260 [Caenispirillum sp.]|nr:hypothetical protein [Caenispirillum sp.]
MTEQLGLSITIDAQLARLEQAMRNAGRVVETATSGMDKSTKRAAQAFSKLEGALDPLSRASNRLQRDMEKVQLAVQKGAVSHERAAMTLKRLGDQYDATVERVNGFNKAQGVAAAGMSRFGGMAQQAGYQVSDLVTQISMGGNALQAFAVQGGQMISMMGPVGAVVGTAATVVGLLAANLLDSDDAARSTKTSMDMLSGSIADQAGDVETLTKRYGELTAAQRNLEQIRLLANMEDQRTQLRAGVATLREAVEAEIPDAGWFDFRDHSEALKPVNDILDQIERGSLDAAAGLEQAELALRRTGKAVGFTGQETRQAAVAVADAGTGYERAQALLAVFAGTATEAQKALIGFKEATGEAGKKSSEASDIFRETTDRLSGYITSLEDQVYLLSLDADQREIQTALMEAQNLAMEQGNLLTAAQIDHIEGLVEAKQRLRDAEEQASKATRLLERQQAEAARKANEASKIFTSAWDEAARAADEFPSDVLDDPEIPAMIQECFK